MKVNQEIEAFQTFGKDSVRHFVLAPTTPTNPAAIPAGAPALGVGQVKIPAHLYTTSIAVRRGANEIEHLPLALWGERLDQGLQRVLAANLAAMVPTDNLRLSTRRAQLHQQLVTGRLHCGQFFELVEGGGG